MMKQANKPHHHGNLRAALVLAGLELIKEEGADSLTLRKCANKAGVSHSAPAHHFDGLKGLRAAIIAEGHEQFAEAMRDASVNSDTTALAQLDAICQGYIIFATAHTGLFKFMFHPHGINPDELNEPTRNAFLEKTNASYQILSDACEPFANSNNLEIETMVWSLVHGYAMLFCGETCVSETGPDFPKFSQLLSRIIL